MSLSKFLKSLRDLDYGSITRQSSVTILLCI